MQVGSERKPDDRWKDWAIDKRGCGGCTVRQFENAQERAVMGLLRLIVGRS